LNQYGLEDYQDEIDLRGAICRDAHFDGADCSGAHFDGANCRVAYFDGAYCNGAHFEGADCIGANFNGAYCSDAHFDGAICIFVNFNGAKCEGAHFDGMNCFEAHFDGADCLCVHFDGAGCNETIFYETNLTNASFRNTNGKDAKFINANLCSADLRDMTVSEQTDFGVCGEQIDAKDKKNDRELWEQAADANMRIKQCFKSDGLYHKANKYQLQEMICRRNMKNWFLRKVDWFFFYLISGYGLDLWHPLFWTAAVIFLGSSFFGFYYKNIWNGIYYSVISFTTLGLGAMDQIENDTCTKIMVIFEALAGTFLMPLFLVAYARRILQD
jgi:hypothetical protein